MREQLLVWRNDFENISFNSRFVEKWMEQEEIYPCSAPVIAVVRGKYQTGVFILNEGETLLLLDNSMKLDVRLVHEWAFLE